MVDVGFVVKTCDFDYMIYINRNGRVEKRKTTIIKSIQFTDLKNNKILDMSFNKQNRLLLDVLQISDLYIKNSSNVNNVVLSSEDECAICMQKIRRRGRRSYSHPNNCDHVFCIDCLRIWSQNNNSCPMCRTPYTSVIDKRCVDSSLLTKKVYPGTVKFLLKKFVTDVQFI
ncbi:hypothetical protein [Pseudoplusia includens SNPV IE]|uniref:RING-type domain-containing protein n=2 Tax=Chrysodeixis includens nucleopolyhedrovirus TaxID=1207438 RepID=A0A1C8ZYS9_9ABAC|nr:hypothetical protein [Pseudoplusia includens SNPV IE]AJD80803.1 hypothetical protein [Pseudoplusia includens SNPV IE]AOL57116.1 hypothetical protein [Chrysodeixis includens nucleopolyhedrovirus]AOL57257.1 hypothetical protein [Chrysodeixis includens nucleopolyhedrovirus]